MKQLAKLKKSKYYKKVIDITKINKWLEMLAKKVNK